MTFFNAQQKKDDEHPYGIEEGDETSLRLKNTAYGFASAIAGAVAGEGGSGSGGLLFGYLKKSGGDMTGRLSANYGFEAGIGNTRILETYLQDITDPEGVVTAVEYGIRITGNLKVGGDSLYIGGRQLLRYDAEQGHRYNRCLPYQTFWMRRYIPKGHGLSGTRIQEYPSPRHGWPWAGRMSTIVATPIRTRRIGRCGTAW